MKIIKKRYQKGEENGGRKKEEEGRVPCSLKFIFFSRRRKTVFSS